MTTGREPSPHAPNTATDAQTPPQQRLLALSGVASVPFFVVAGVGALVAVAP